MRSAGSWVERRRRGLAAWQARRPPRAPRPEPQGSAAVLSTSSAILAIVCAWTVAHLLFLGNVSHARSQDLLFGEFRTQLAGLTAPVGPIVPPGDPVALVQIPSLGLEEVVVEGTAAGDLFAGPGHKRNTVLPGQVGASVVYGRSTTYGAPFADIPSLTNGDPIEVVMAQGEVTMYVLGVRRDGDPLPPPPADGVARLTLVTTEGGGRLAALTPGETVYVDAEAVEGFAVPGGVPPTIPESEEALARGTTALPMLCLCLILLTALTVAIIAARQRWSVALVWVIAAPVAVALAWGTTDTAMRLLPNLI